MIEEAALFLRALPWRGVACILLVTLGFAFGHRMASLEAKEATAKQAKELAEWKTKAEQVNTITITKYVDRIQTIHDKGETLLKEVQVYVPRNVCVLPADVRRLHDNAAILPGASAGADGKASAPEEAAGEGR